MTSFRWNINWIIDYSDYNDYNDYNDYGDHLNILKNDRKYEITFYLFKFFSC
jgi:hypothetical protein